MNAKITLSQKELSMVQDSDWLLTKNSIIEKTKLLFGRLAASLQKEKLPDVVQLFSPKIFKGEYYQGLPYVMLDYPRIFSKDDVFAMRTMFWWGNFFSVTLQLKGKYQQLYGPGLLSNSDQLIKKNFHVAVSTDEWRHDFNADNYEQVNTENLSKALNGAFIKIAVRLPLSEWNDAERLMRMHQHFLIEILSC